jgi:hypothetical protein
MHKHGGPRGRAAEDQANVFASAFLMPASDVLALLPRIHTLNQVIEAKKRWAVSAMSLVHRLNRLKIMSDWQYRMFCINATDLGYRRAEPFGISREHSVVWHKVLTAPEQRTTKSDIARALHIPAEIENLLFGLAGDTGDRATSPLLHFRLTGWLARLALTLIPKAGVGREYRRSSRKERDDYPGQSSEPIRSMIRLHAGAAARRELISGCSLTAAREDSKHELDMASALVGHSHQLGCEVCYKEATQLGPLIAQVAISCSDFGRR